MPAIPEPTDHIGSDRDEFQPENDAERHEPPTLLPRGDSGENVLLVHTHDFLNQITVNAGDSIQSVTAGAGAHIDDICRALEAYDLGLYHTTAPGGVTIAGALAQLNALDPHRIFTNLYLDRLFPAAG